MQGHERELEEAKLMPAEGQYVKVRDLTVYYEKFGSGEPLVLLHGGTVNARRMWEKFVPTLSKHFQVIAPDSRGHGKTNNPAGELSFRLMADDAAAFIRTLGLERPSICGYSDGGQVCLEIGMHYPAIVSKLVVGGAHNRLRDEDLASLKEIGVEGRGKVDLQQFEKAAPQLVSRIKETFTAYDAEYWKTYAREISKMWLMPLNYTPEDYRKITAPTLILLGDRDPDVSLEDALEMYRSIPKAELAVAPGSDHYFPWSKTELFTSIVIDFLQRRNAA